MSCFAEVVSICFATAAIVFALAAGIGVLARLASKC
jgi:hypothetical protein